MNFLLQSPVFQIKDSKMLGYETLCQISMDIGALSPANNRALYYVQKHTAVIFSVTGSGKLKNAKVVLCSSLIYDDYSRINYSLNKVKDSHRYSTLIGP